MDAGELSRLQLIIWPGEEGGIIMQTEILISKFCAEEKLKTKTSEYPGFIWNPIHLVHVGTCRYVPTCTDLYNDIVCTCTYYLRNVA